MLNNNIAERTVWLLGSELPALTVRWLPTLTESQDLPACHQPYNLQEKKHITHNKLQLVFTGQRQIHLTLTTQLI